VNRGTAFATLPRLPRLRFDGSTALLSLEGLRVLDRSTLAVVEQSLTEVQARGGLQRLVIHNPAPDFMIGVDTQWIVACMQTDDFDAIRRFVEHGQWWLRSIDALPLTVVMAVDGLATGAGAEWLAAADAVVATPRARIGLPETGLGIYPALGGTQRVPRRIGLGAARWMVLTGEYVDATAARKLGWVDRIVEADDLLDAARRVVPVRARAAHVKLAPLALGATSPLLSAFGLRSLDELMDLQSDAADVQRAVDHLRRRAPIALRIADELLRASTQIPLEEGLAREIEQLRTVYATRDALTGLRAGAAGRRAARFSGH
jgi:enoyl-CoA hydratase/carnithine racemase